MWLLGASGIKMDLMNLSPHPLTARCAAALGALALLLSACEQEYEIVPEPVDVDPGDVTDCAFTRVEDTNFYAYDCNPVFTTTGEDWAPYVGATAFNVTYVMDHPFYQLWYVAYDDDDSYAMGYAVSNNGTDWEPYSGNPVITQDGAKGFERDVMQANQVVWDPKRGKYVMIYSGLDLTGSSDGGTGVMTSSDGLDWARVEQNPVLLANDTEVDGISGFCWPLDVNLANEGYTGYISGTVGRSGACEAFRLDGSSPSEWSVDGDVAFPAGDEGDWDDEGLIALNEVELNGKHYLFYVGFGDWTVNGSVRTATHSFVGWAQSEDGFAWDKKSEPIPLNTTEAGEVGAVAAVTVGNRIHLWVTDEYDGGTGVGLFLYDPAAAAAEDGEE